MKWWPEVTSMSFKTEDKLCSLSRDWPFRSFISCWHTSASCAFIISHSSSTPPLWHGPLSLCQTYDSPRQECELPVHKQEMKQWLPIHFSSCWNPRYPLLFLLPFLLGRMSNAGRREGKWELRRAHVVVQVDCRPFLDRAGGSRSKSLLAWNTAVWSIGCPECGATTMTDVCTSSCSTAAKNSFNHPLRTTKKQFPLHALLISWSEKPHRQIMKSWYVVLVTSAPSFCRSHSMP